MNKYLLLTVMLANVSGLCAQQEVVNEKTTNNNYVEYAKGSLQAIAGVTGLSISALLYSWIAYLYATGEYAHGDADFDPFFKSYIAPFIMTGLIPYTYNSYNTVKDALYNFKLLQNRSKKSYKKSILKMVSGFLGAGFSVTFLKQGSDYAGMIAAILCSSSLYTLGSGIIDCKDVYNAKNNHN